MNKFTLSVVALALSAASLPGAVLAQTTPTPDFATVDSDKSGEVSYGELQIVMPKISEEQFKSADGDKSGGLSATEFASISAGGTQSLTTPAPDSTATPAAPAK